MIIGSPFRYFRENAYSIQTENRFLPDVRKLDAKHMFYNVDTLTFVRANRIMINILSIRNTLFWILFKM